MNGAIKREQGETFASFAARQRQAQIAEAGKTAAMYAMAKARRKTIRKIGCMDDSGGDFDYSMNG